MEQIFEAHGCILKHRPAGEYDWLVTLLCAERGKINAFARGARRPAGKLTGNTEPFCFGTFFLTEGRSAYVLQDAKIDAYFEQFRTDLEKASYGTFFLEIADYYTRENIEAKDFLNLLYLTLRVLDRQIEGLNNRLVRCVYELRAMVQEGIFPGPGALHTDNAAVRQALWHIANVPLASLYHFTLSDDALKILCEMTHDLRNRLTDRRPNSLDMLRLYESDPAYSL